MILYTILFLTCAFLAAFYGGIYAVIEKIKYEFRIYKYYIVRGIIFAYTAFLAITVLMVMFHKGGLGTKIFSSFMGIIFGGLYFLFPAIYIGGLAGWGFGKFFGKANRPDPKSDKVLENLRNKYKSWSKK
mgnify:CR=1 FL=1